MSLRLFRNFPQAWDKYEQQIRIEFLKRFQTNNMYRPEVHPHALSDLYDRLGGRYWLYNGDGILWFMQFDGLFFDRQYYEYRIKFYRYRELDTLAAERFKQLPDRFASCPKKVYRHVLKPCLDARKQEIQKDLIYLEAQLHTPVTYTLTLPEKPRHQSLLLAFHSAYQKNSDYTDLENYSFRFHKRTYRNVDALWEKDIEQLSENMFLGQDAFGEQVLKIYTQVPTFDSGDREWDSKVLEYLFFDGRAVNLLVLNGGYRIASLTFYETLLTENTQLQPYLEKMGWSMDKIAWPKRIGAWLKDLCIR